MEQKALIRLQTKDGEIEVVSDNKENKENMNSIAAGITKTYSVMMCYWWIAEVTVSKDVRINITEYGGQWTTSMKELQ